MARYFSTFIPGFGELVQSQLKKEFSDLQVELLLDGLILYQTEASIEEVFRLRFLNNSFYVFHFFKKIERNSLVRMMKFVYQSDFLKKMSVPRVKGRDRTFRVITSYENKLGAVDLNILKNAEEKIGRATRFRLDRGLPDLEFWFLERSEKVGFFALRLTYDRRSEKSLLKGELRPELCNLLCLLSEPSLGDVFLDPFSGTGAIPKERAKFPYEEILISEKETEKVHTLREEIKGKGIKVFHGDATNLSLKDGSVNKVVTDPPWGEFDKTRHSGFAGWPEDIERLYRGMFAEFGRIIAPGGIVVILSSQKELVEKILAEQEQFKPAARYNILVSGRKAGVFKLSCVSRR